MDSPERDQEQPVNDTQCQESPFFKFLCSLSPIKQVKSLHVVQSYSELTFPSAPTVFASPQLDHKGVGIPRPDEEHRGNIFLQRPDEDPRSSSYLKCGTFSRKVFSAECSGSEVLSTREREPIDLNERLSEPVVEEPDAQPVEAMPMNRDVDGVPIASLNLNEDNTNTNPAPASQEASTLKALDIGQRGFRRCLAFEAPKPEEPETFVTPSLQVKDHEHIGCSQSQEHIVSSQEHVVSSQGSSMEVPSLEENLPSLSIITEELQCSPAIDQVQRSSDVDQVQCSPECSPAEQDRLEPMQTYSMSDGEDTSPESPKRRKSKQMSRSGCKRCKCKKSRCLKLYCECFSAGAYCVGSCTCRDCFNNAEHSETVIEARQLIETRNPLAFAPKVIRTMEASPAAGLQQEENAKTPASARHKRGCNCKKSLCLKKYCECYQGGVGCSGGCKCDGCQNIFGKKEGLELSELVKLEHMDPDEQKPFIKNLSPTTPYDEKSSRLGKKSAKKKRPVDQLGSPLPTSGSHKSRKSRLIPDMRPCPALSPLADPRPCQLVDIGPCRSMSPLSDTRPCPTPDVSPSLSPLVDVTKQAAPSPRWDGLDDICTLTPLPQHPTRPTPSSTVTSDRLDDPFMGIGDEKATPTFPLLFQDARDSGMDICDVSGVHSPQGFRKMVLVGSPNAHAAL